MSIFKSSLPPEADDDLSCNVCSTPLLSAKTKCPRCGHQNTQDIKVKAAQAKEAYKKTDPIQESFAAFEEIPETPLDDLLTASFTFFAGLGLLFALLNPIIDGFDMTHVYRSFVVMALSLGLLGMRRLMLKR
jgi:hypothetical protein